MSDRQLCQYFSSLQPGTAIVKLSTGDQRVVKFYERTSQHVSHTPKVIAALNRYSSMQFSPDMNFGADIELDIAPAPQLHTTGEECSRRTCHEPASHIYTFSTLRVSSQGRLEEQKHHYFCSEHANRQCKPIERV
jgi:hypothetical protein